MFDSYGGAVFAVLQERGLTKKWLAERIKPEDTSLSSVQSYLSRWTGGANVSEEYRQRIERILDVRIKQNNKGKFEIRPGPVSYEAQSRVDQLREKAQQYKDAGPTLDDLPEIVRLKRELEELIDELLKR